MNETRNLYIGAAAARCAAFTENAAIQPRLRAVPFYGGRRRLCRVVTQPTNRAAAEVRQGSAAAEDGGSSGVGHERVICYSEAALPR